MKMTPGPMQHDKGNNKFRAEEDKASGERLGPVYILFVPINGP